jgi:predicted regulator of Ras-like GTPase activity (Roadblock/LC7/MglB family)
MAVTVELDDRIAKCNKILNENPNSQIFAALSEALRKKGDVDKAFRVCQTGLKIHPDYGSAHLVMSKINIDKGMLDWAEMEVRKAMEIDGHSHSVDLLLAEILIHKEDYAEATRLLKKLKATGANDKQVTRLLQFAKRLPMETAPPVAHSPRPTPHASELPTEIRPVAAAEVVESKPESPAVPTKQIGVDEFLDELAGISGVDGVMVVNHEGLVVESRWANQNQLDLYGALVKDIEATIKAQIDLSHFGDYENIMIEAEELVLILHSLKNNILLIKAGRELNLGTLRLRLASLLSRLADDIS